MTLNIHLNVGKLRGTAKYPIRAQLNDLQKIMSSIFDQVENAAPEIMLDALIPTRDLAAYYCPKKTGALVESEYLEVTSFRGSPRVELGFAKGGEPPYGIYVHEMVDYQHAFPTRSKFLQAAVMEDMDGIISRVTGNFKDFMFSHGGAL